MVARRSLLLARLGRGLIAGWGGGGTDSKTGTLLAIPTGASSVTTRPRSALARTVGFSDRLLRLLVRALYGSAGSA